jgi:hypothetical protein
MVGFAAWSIWYYRPTVEYAYTDISPVWHVVFVMMSLLLVSLIAWRVFKK